jgi:glycosyltransferase involved in cell wall biosynthesis
VREDGQGSEAPRGELAGMSISVFVPAYNAEGTIEGVLKRIPTHLWPSLKNVWIVNDGSTDRTGQVVEYLSRSYEQVNLVQFVSNKGYGAAVKAGLAACRNDGCDAAVCLHSDGQYPPEAIPEFVRTMRDKRLDVLQGSRIASGTALSGGMPLYKYAANRALTKAANRVFGLRMSDYYSGFLCYSRRALDTIGFDRLSDSFDFDLEVIASARRLGLAIGELPIPTRYAGEKSYLNPVTYGLRVVGVLGRFVASRYS